MVTGRHPAEAIITAIQDARSAPIEKPGIAIMNLLDWIASSVEAVCRDAFVDEVSRNMRRTKYVDLVQTVVEHVAERDAQAGIERSDDEIDLLCSLTRIMVAGFPTIKSRGTVRRRFPTTLVIE